MTCLDWITQLPPPRGAKSMGKNKNNVETKGLYPNNTGITHAFSRTAIQMPAG